MSLKEITTTATSGNIAGLPPDEPPISKKKQKKMQDLLVKTQKCLQKKSEKWKKKIMD